MNKKALIKGNGSIPGSFGCREKPRPIRMAPMAKLNQNMIVFLPKNPVMNIPENTPTIEMAWNMNVEVPAARPDPATIWFE